MTNLDARVRGLTPSGRPWHFPFVCALCIGIPVIIGAALRVPTSGALASLGALAILYYPLHGSGGFRLKRMAWVSAGLLSNLILGFSLGVHPAASVASLVVVSALIYAVSLVQQLPPPGSFFFVLIFAMAVTQPFMPSLMVERVLTCAAGSIFSCFIAIVYTRLTIDSNVIAITPARKPSFDRKTMIKESGYFGLMVGGALAVGIGLGLKSPYWVATSCAAILPAATSLRHGFSRVAHRVIGTLVGFTLTIPLLAYLTNPIYLALTLMALSFVVESLITRHYGLAVVFITPLTVILAEIVVRPQIPGELGWDRLLDTTIGCGISMIYVLCRYDPKHRQTSA